MQFKGQQIVCFKILSDQLSIGPNPKPKLETFVYSSYVEGVHLRMSKVVEEGLGGLIV